MLQSLKMESAQPLRKKICFLIFAMIFKQNLNVEAKNSKTAELANVIVTKYGPIQGKIIQVETGEEVLVYLGIPYATAMRFESPRPPKNWRDILNTSSYRNACPEASNGLKEKPLSESNLECLFLNVYVPNGAFNASLPVVVWFQSGLGKSKGTGRDVDKSYIAAEGRFVIVTVNYRLGIFGYLSTGDEQIKGNFGSRDQVQALRWVRENIGR